MLTGIDPFVLAFTIGGAALLLLGIGHLFGYVFRVTKSALQKFPDLDTDDSWDDFLSAAAATRATEEAGNVEAKR